MRTVAGLTAGHQRPPHLQLLSASRSLVLRPGQAGLQAPALCHCPAQPAWVAHSRPGALIKSRGTQQVGGTHRLGGSIGT